jgi:predicted MPP superfamily phosphohydrolase
LRDEQPDLIVLGGDYVTQRDRRFIAPSADVLAPLSAPHGVYAVLGNHDDDVEMPRALRRAGAEVLRDERTRLHLRGTTLDLIGLRYWTRAPAALARLAHGSAPSTLLLAHDPRRLDEARALGIPAVLSGHTHGGQIALPGLEWLATRKFPTSAGVLTTPSSTLFVSRGVGTVYVPCRVNCPPEVAILTLAAAARTGQPQRG